MFIVSPFTNDTGPALVHVVAVSAIVQLSPVAVPFFITVTVSVAVLPPDCAVPDNVTERFDSVEAAVKVYLLALLDVLMDAELVALPNRHVDELQGLLKKLVGNTCVPLLSPENNPWTVTVTIADVVELPALSVVITWRS